MKIIIRLLLSLFFLTTNAKAFEIIRDTELEQFTFDIVSNLLDTNKQEFMKSRDLDLINTSVD